MVEKKRVALLNILPTMLLLYLVLNFQLVFVLRHDSAPGKGLAAVGPAWPIALVLGSSFPTGVVIISILIGIFTAFRFHSRWGAAYSSALAILTLMHFLVVACIG